MPWWLPGRREGSNDGRAWANRRSWSPGNTGLDGVDQKGKQRRGSHWCEAPLPPAGLRLRAAPPWDTWTPGPGQPGEVNPAYPAP